MHSATIWCDELAGGAEMVAHVTNVGVRAVVGKLGANVTKRLAEQSVQQVEPSTVRRAKFDRVYAEIGRSLDECV